MLFFLAHVVFVAVWTWFAKRRKIEVRKIERVAAKVLDITCTMSTSFGWLTGCKKEHLRWEVIWYIFPWDGGAQKSKGSCKLWQGANFPCWRRTRNKSRCLALCHWSWCRDPKTYFLRWTPEKKRPRGPIWVLGMYTVDLDPSKAFRIDTKGYHLFFKPIPMEGSWLVLGGVLLGSPIC